LPLVLERGEPDLFDVARRMSEETPMTAGVLVRHIDALCRRRVVVLPLLALVAIAFTSPLYLRPMNLGHGDWLWFHFIWDSARKTYLDFHEIPWWNPYYCGGNLGLANPNGFSASPLFLLLLPLPTALAMKAYLTTMTFGGLTGMYELCRRRYAGGLWAVVAAVFFSCSGYMGWHMNGQTGMANLHLLPWAALFYLEGIRRPAAALCAGLVLAFMLCNSGVYPCVITSVALASHGLVVALEGRWGETLRAIRSGAIAATSALAYAAFKLVPVVDYLRDHRRPIPKDDAIGLPVLIDALLVRRTTETQIWPHQGYAYAWWGEYSNYIGWAGIALVVAAIAVAGKRRERWLALAALGLVIGDHGSYSPYAILRSLPMVGNLRVPTRYWVVVDLWVGLMIASAGWRLSRRASLRLPGAARWWALAAMLGVAGVFVVDVVRNNGIAIMRGAMPTAPAPLNIRKAEFHQVRGSSWDMFRYPPRNLGTLHCFDELTVDISPALRAGLPSEAYLLEPDAGTVRIDRWSPSRWELSVDLSRPATVIVNQNAFRGWRVEGGTLVPHDGLVAAQVPAGKHALTVLYRPVGYLAGALVSLLSLSASLALALRLARRARAASAASAASSASA
jgi:hypothetical protein